MRALLTDESSDHDYTDEELDIIITINLVMGLLSSGYVIVHFLLMKSLQSQLSFRIIFWVAVSDFIMAATFVMGAPEEGTLCTIQGVGQQFGSQASLMWVVAISGTIDYLMSTKELPTRRKLKKMLLWMHIIIWSFSALTTIIPFFTNSYGPSGGWCWFKDDGDVIHTIWRYLLFYVWVWVAIAWLLVFYVRTWLKLRNLDKAEERRMSASEAPSGTIGGSFTSDGEGGGFSINSPGGDGRKPTIKMVEHQNGTENGTTGTATEEAPKQMTEQKKDTKRKRALSRMGLFPLVLIVGYFFGTVRRIYEAFSDQSAPFWLAVCQTIFYAMMPVFDSLIYGMTKAVRKHDMKVLRRFCCCKEQE